MADSVTRLYLAWFDRAPDQAGLHYWVGRYQAGLGLEAISEAFERSPEANELAGNPYFVDWMYRSLAPNEVPTNYEAWVTRLSAGYPRARAVLSFTEAEGYVNQTHTAKPLAGFLRWYPAGTRWYCGTGQATVATPDLTSGVHVDYLLRNKGKRSDPVGIWTESVYGHRNVRIVTEDLAAGMRDYQWDGSFNGSGHYGSWLNVSAGSSTTWVIVLSPSGIGSERDGW